MSSSTTEIDYPKKNIESVFGDIKAWHFAVRTTKYKELIAWYQENLDFRLVREFTSGEMLLALIAPPGDNNFLIEVLGVKETSDSEKPQIKSGYDHLCFSVNNLDKTMEALASRNIKVDMAFPAPAIGKRVAFITDPFGNRLEFAEDLKN